MRSRGASVVVLTIAALSWGGCGPSIVEDPPPQAGSSTTSPSAGSSSDSVTPPPPMTTGSITTTGLDGSSDDTTSIGFINNPDGCFAPPGASTHCTTIECDYVAQNCPRGERCVPWDPTGGNEWRSARCSPVERSPDPDGASCSVVASPTTGVDTCELGSMCWAVDPDSNQGVCVPGCDPRNDTCEAPQYCAWLSDESFTMCITPCHPLDPAGCPVGEACRWLIGNDAFVCLPEIGGEVWRSGRTCGMEDATCLPGEACIPAESLVGCDDSECCSPWCDTGDPMSDALCDAMQPGHACLTWWEKGSAPPGYEGVGVCAMAPA